MAAILLFKSEPNSGGQHGPGYPLSNEDAMRIMMKAHNKGKSNVKTGTYKEMDSMKAGLNGRNLTASIYQSKS